MKKIILLLFFLITKSIVSQNGFNGYYNFTSTVNINANNGPPIFIDNFGKKWIGYFNTASPNAVLISVYDTLNYKWTFYDRINTPSLPIATIKAICNDNSNNIWFATTAGLIKYDGTNFTLLTTTNGLPSNSITDVESFNNMIYITTNAGLSRYDGTSFTNYNTGNSLFPFNNLSSLKIENSNTLWIASGSNLIKFYINSSYTSSSFTTSALTSTPYVISSLYIDASGNKWLGTAVEPVMYDNTNFNYFSSMYPNFFGADHFDGIDMCKGPNNGVAMFASVYGSSSPSAKCLVELMPGGNYNLYYTEDSNNASYISKHLANSGNNIIYIAAIYGGPTSPLMFSFNKNYYTGNGIGPGAGINQNNFKYIDINRVKAGIMNRGDMWSNPGTNGKASYEVPKGSGTHGGSYGALWIGAICDMDGLHTSAQTYRQSGSDFWPGPLDTTNAKTDTAHINKYDKIWKVSYTDINTFVTQFNLGNVPTSYTPTPDMVSWPAHGTGNNARNLAPFVDVNGDGIYNWKDGDYPKIKGDQTLYYIFNDNYTQHTETNGKPLGIEVHAMAYAYGCPNSLAGKNELAYTTFYDYKIYNRSNNNYHDVYIGLWSDADIGCYNDDYVGSDPNLNLGFCYNSTAIDRISCSGVNAYGNFPPAAGTTVLKGPLATSNDGLDNNNNGFTDEINEQCLLNVFDYYTPQFAGPPQYSGPTVDYQYYNFLTAKWNDNTNFTCGGNAYGGTIPTKFVYPNSNYPGNSCGSATWNEYTAGNLAGDRKYIAASGPFNLGAKQMTEIEYAYVWSVDSSATSNVNLASMNKLLSDVSKVRSFYAGTAPNCLLSIDVKEEQLFSSPFTLFPNPGISVVTVKAYDVIKSIAVVDVAGRLIISNNEINKLNSEINIEDLSNGVYFVTVSGNGWKNTRKLIKN